MLVDDEVMIDDSEYAKLKQMVRKNKPYVTLLELPESVNRKVKRKDQAEPKNRKSETKKKAPPKKKTKKETADRT